jgi:hypothetical protein
MALKIPKRILPVLGFLSLTSFLLGIYLEGQHLQTLERHPYLSNVLSGVTGFCTSALVITVVIDQYVNKERLEQYAPEIGHVVDFINYHLRSLAQNHYSVGQVAPEYRLQKTSKPLDRILCKSPVDAPLRIYDQLGIEDVLPLMSLARDTEELIRILNLEASLSYEIQELKRIQSIDPDRPHLLIGAYFSGTTLNRFDQTLAILHQHVVKIAGRFRSDTNWHPE